MFNSIKSLIGGRRSISFLVSPKKVEFTVLQTSLAEGDLSSGRWLNFVTRFEDSPIFLGLQQHFAAGTPWRQTEYHGLIKNGFHEKRIQKMGGEDAYYEYYDRLFDFFATSDMRAILKLPPVQVLGGMGEDLVRYDGNHRLSFALILDKPLIRIRYKHCHRDHIRQDQIVDK